MNVESAVKLTIGFILLGASLAYLYRPSLVLRFNAWGRAILLNDAHLLHYRRRWGLLAFLFSILFLYSAMLNLSSEPRREAPPADLSPGYQAFYERRYADAMAVAQRILEGTPGDPSAEFLLRQARVAAKKSPRTP